jgi:hypothetical protein
MRAYPTPGAHVPLKIVHSVSIAYYADIARDVSRKKLTMEPEKSQVKF